jgi:CheY-like chemotaxis protein/anti-sigma regulatory factor (Ser/Thr protein kinase)
LQEIAHAGQRAALLTRQLLTFSRKQVMQPSVVSLLTLVTNVRAMLQRLIGEDIRLVISPGTGDHSVKADPGQLEQVVMNLVVNARDAMPHGGTLTITVGDVEAEGTGVAEVDSAPRGSYVRLAVRDTGTGMDDLTRARVFEPFFTTKECGKGTGLGLATVFGIIKQSRGAIAVDSAPGRGTTFRIYLPRVASVTAAKPAVAPAPASAATETLLVVEDEDSVRRMARRMLESIGYTVLTARSAAEALLMLERRDQKVHLMLTDVVMPGMSGPDLVARLAEIHPGIRVLYTSGHADNAALRDAVLDGGIEFISKPYTRAELTRKVRDILDARA